MTIRTLTFETKESDHPDFPGLFVTASMDRGNGAVLLRHAVPANTEREGIVRCLDYFMQLLDGRVGIGMGDEKKHVDL